MASIEETWQEDCERAAHALEVAVRCGLLDQEEIVERLLDDVAFDLGYLEADELEDDEVDEWREFLESLVARRLQGYLSQQRSRGAGDCEALLETFRDLTESEIIALHFAGDTQTAALRAIFEMHGAGGSDAIGYAFFTVQDAEQAVDGSLLLGFGGFDASDGAEIARRVLRGLEARGLHGEWSGDESVRIAVRIDWNWPRSDEPPHEGHELDAEAAPWIWDTHHESAG